MGFNIPGSMIKRIQPGYIRICVIRNKKWGRSLGSGLPFEI